jgi:hypothetical protein
MSLEFVIVPLAETYESDAYNIMNLIKQDVSKEIDIEIDTNYNTSLNSRLGKYRRQDKDIITVNNEYNESKSIVIRFSGKGSKPTCMYLQDFIDLISSLEYDNSDDDVENETETTKKEAETTNTDTNQEESSGGCYIM